MIVRLRGKEDLGLVKTEISGVCDELIGRQERDEAGALSLSR